MPIKLERRKPKAVDPHPLRPYPHDMAKTAKQFIEEATKADLNSKYGARFEAEDLADNVEVFTSMFGHHLKYLMENGNNDLAKRGLMIVEDFLLNGDNEIRGIMRERCFENLSFPRESKFLMLERSAEFKSAFIERKQRRHS